MFKIQILLSTSILCETNLKREEREVVVYKKVKTEAVN